MADYTNDKDNSSNEQVEHLDKGVVNKLIREADLRLIPALGLLYTFSLVDRVNLSVVCHHLDHNVISRLFADNRHRPGWQEWASSWDCPSATDILLLR
jgi:hypothetical protein